MSDIKERIIYSMKENEKDIKLTETKDMLEINGFGDCDFDAFIASLGIECIEVIPPINSTACCVRRADRQWAAFELGNKTPIVDFGKYNYMWGFDNGYCLVSVADKDIIKISSVMETYTFFKMIYSLVSLFSGSEEKYNENMIPMTEFAKFVDSQSSAIFKTIKDQEKIRMMSDDEYEKWLLQATKYKVKMLRLVTKLVKEWEPKE